MLNATLYLVGSFLVVASAVLALACVVTQAVLTRWWKTPFGRHVFAFQSALAACLCLWALRLAIPDGGWFIALRFAAFAAIPVVLAWRLLIIIQTWRKQRRERKEAGDRE